MLQGMVVNKHIRKKKKKRRIHANAICVAAPSFRQKILHHGTIIGHQPKWLDKK
jgi:hypothetical protein